MKHACTTWTLGLGLLLLPLVIGCGGGGDGSDCPPPAVTNLSGDWTGLLVRHTSSPACLGDDGKTDDIDFTLTQAGSAIALQANMTAGPMTIPGRVCGNEVQLQPFVDDETTTTSFTMTLTSPTSGILSGTWVWSDGGDSCSGTYSGTATKP